MPLVEPRHARLFWALFAVFTIFGMSMTIIGAALPKILASFGWSYVVAGMVLAANAIAYFSFTFVGGYALKFIGPKRTIITGLLISATGLAFFAATPDPLTNILLSGLIGVGQGFVEITVNWTTLRLDSAKSGRPMNLMHGAFAVGAILGPLALAGLIAAGFDWITIYHAMAGIYAALALLFMAMPMRVDAQAEPETDSPPQRLTTHPAYYLSFLALFFYVGVELGEFGVDDRPTGAGVRAVPATVQRVPLRPVRATPPAPRAGSVRHRSRVRHVVPAQLRTRRGRALEHRARAPSGTRSPRALPGQPVRRRRPGVKNF